MTGNSEAGTDLDRRASTWSHHFSDHSLESVSGFAAALAGTEASAWRAEEGDVATRAYESRRFLFADRMIHWAVPWLLASAEEARAETLLDLGDEMRVATQLPGREGLLLSGEDSLGPLSNRESFWSGWVSVPDRDPPADIPGHWRALAERHPGSAQLWLDLAARAERH